MSDNKPEKLKGLIPSLRQKKRFVVFKIVSSEKFTFKEVSYSFIEQLITFIGTIDFGKGGVWLIRDKFNENKQIGLLKCSTKLKDKTIGAVSLINNINGKNVKVEVLGVSGTMKGTEKFIK